MPNDDALGLVMPAAAAQTLEIVLKPISCPEVGEIRIGDSLFAIGRTEAPFASYPPALVAELSRRHARIFSEFGAVYIADLGSKNGTTVNGIAVRQKPSRLQEGDEVCFGRVLSYRVELGARAAAAGRIGRLVSLALTPERGDLGLQPIVVSHFPFLISKTDEAFARYKDDYPHQVNYLSRRHAHIFLKGGLPFIEDLGSTNGTFVADRRLDEHAVPLQEGDLLAFGGHHFVYRVSLQMEMVEIEPTVTRLSSFSASAGEAAAEADKTTFVAAADSFLDIFCVDQAGAADDALASEAEPAAAAAQRTDRRRRARGKVARFVGELARAFGGGDKPRPRSRRLLYGTIAVLAALVTLSLVLYLRSTPEREVQELLAGGDYAQAAALVRESLARDPENAELKALGSEALLKATVPNWLDELQARQFERASATLAGTSELALRNAELEPLIDELEWLGRLEQFVVGRGGVEAPIRVYADEEPIRSLLARWDEDPQGHQRALARIASYVPEFREPYGEALSHLRKLQSDGSVYLTAIERLKATIASELKLERAEALVAVLDEYAEKYPRLGLDGVRQDLARYRELESAVQAGKPGRLLALAARAQFATPPFQERWQALAANRLPPPAVVEQYRAVVKAWRQGDTKQALAGLQQMTGGPWGEAAAEQLARKQAIVERFAALRQARGSAGYGERLLAFHGTLDADEDVHFIRAVEAELGPYKEPVLARSRELLQRARAQWSAYRQNGPIASEQRLESTISKQFRSQAQRLSEAQQTAQQGLRMMTQLKASETSELAEWQKLVDEIAVEAELQRKSLQELRTVLIPRLLEAKLALIGARDDEQSGDQRQ